MSSKRNIFFYLGAAGWFVLVMALIIYMFFPYQKALRIALQIRRRAAALQFPWKA